MDRILVIDQDRPAMEQMGLACLERGVGVVITETVCQGVRVLLSTPVSSIVVDQRLLRLTPREHGTLFDRVAPDVPVVVVIGPETPLDVRVAHELVGFRVVARPVVVEDLLEKTLVEAVSEGARP
jgi:DNA-binding NtrC family response regulator